MALRRLQKSSDVIFTWDNYKDYLKHRFLGPKNRGMISRVADHLGCQRSYISRILSSEVQLTPDFAYKLGKFLGLSELEQEYFCLLVERQRASDPDFKIHLGIKVQSLKQKGLSHADRSSRGDPFGDPKHTAESSRYFSHWAWTAIHLALSVSQYQSVQQLETRFQLPREFILEVLSSLEDLNFASRVGDKWHYKGGEFHLERKDPYGYIHAVNWRQKALQSALKQNTENIHYTLVQTLSLEDAKKLKLELMKYIENLNKVAGPSKPEEVYVFLFDLFKA